MVCSREAQLPELEAAQCDRKARAASQCPRSPATRVAMLFACAWRRRAPTWSVAGAAAQLASLRACPPARGGARASLFRAPHSPWTRVRARARGGKRRSNRMERRGGKWATQHKRPLALACGESFVRATLLLTTNLRRYHHCYY